MDFAATRKLLYLAGDSHDRRPVLRWWAPLVTIDHQKSPICMYIYTLQGLHMSGVAPLTRWQGGPSAQKFLPAQFCHCHKVVATKWLAPYKASRGGGGNGEADNTEYPRC